MKHAVLGVGAIGGLIAAALAEAGEDVTAVVRRTALPPTPSSFEVRRTGNTSLSGRVHVVENLDADSRVDVLWVATKAMHLDDALQRVHECSPRAVVPLLNGVEHVDKLKAMFDERTVVAASIAVEAERVGPGRVRQVSSFARLRLAKNSFDVLGSTAAVLERQGFGVEFVDDAKSLLWSKVVFLAPFALTTCVSGMSAGPLREDAHWRVIFDRAVDEVVVVARSEGATVSSEAALKMLDSVHPLMQSSMYKDVTSGREPEVDAIGGAVVRAAKRGGIKVPVLRDLLYRMSVL